MRVVIAGGGTGGHLFPGIAIAEELRTRGHEVSFVGTERGIEHKVLPKEGWPLSLIAVRALKGGGVGGAMKGLFAVPRALSQCGAILQALAPDLVVGVGGYASGPMVLRAAMSRLPTAILEQNSVPGLTNRMLGKVVRLVVGAFAGAERFFPAQKYRLLGNPVRIKVRAGMAATDTSTRKLSGGLLIVGGSQGAHAVNELVAGALEILHKRGMKLSVVHQTGVADLDGLVARYAVGGIAVDALAFIDDMAGAYRGARLCVARAGASTLAELTTLGVPSLLIPLPSAADDHQTANARDLEGAGAAVVLAQKETTPTSLADSIEALYGDDAKLAQMSAAARSMARPEAHREITDALLSLVEAGA